MRIEHKSWFITSVVILTIAASAAICFLFRVERLESFKISLGTIAKTAAIELDSKRITPTELSQQIRDKFCSFMVITRLQNTRFTPIYGTGFPANFNDYIPEGSDIINVHPGSSYPEFTTDRVLKENLLAVVVPISKYDGDRAFCFIGASYPPVNYVKFLVITLLCCMPLSVLIICIILASPSNDISAKTKTKALSPVSDNQILQLGRLASLRQVTSGIIHEINQPLCIIKGYLGLLQMMWVPQEEDEEETEEQKAERQAEIFATSQKYIDLCLTNVDRTGNILDHIRKFVRDYSEEKAAVNPVDAINNVMDFFGEQFSKRNIKLELKLPETLNRRIDISQALLEQAIVNLLANARDSLSSESYKGYESGKKKVIFTLEDNIDFMTFTLEDNGEGMKPEVLEKCLDPFFTTNPNNSGIGLTTVNIIVNDANGSMKINSISGRGTNIVITLPAIEAKNIEQTTKPGDKDNAAS